MEDCNEGARGQDGGGAAVGSAGFSVSLLGASLLLLFPSNKVVKYRFPHTRTPSPGRLVTRAAVCPKPLLF